MKPRILRERSFEFHEKVISNRPARENPWEDPWRILGGIHDGVTLGSGIGIEGEGGIAKIHAAPPAKVRVRLTDPGTNTLCLKLPQPLQGRTL